MPAVLTPYTQFSPLIPTAGELYASVKLDDCLWSIVDGKILEVTLQKVRWSLVLMPGTIAVQGFVSYLNPTPVLLFPGGPHAVVEGGCEGSARD